MSVLYVTIDLTTPYPDLRPGDVVFGVSSYEGIVNELRVHRPVDQQSALAYSSLLAAGVDQETARKTAPIVMALAYGGRA